MNLSLSHPLRFLRRPSNPKDDGTDLPGGGAGAAEDRGDDFTPTEDDLEDKQKPDEPKPDDKGGEGEGGGEGGDAAGGEADALRNAGKDDAKAKDGKGDGEGDETTTGTPKAGKGKMIPLERHEKILQRERAERERLEAQLASSQAGKEVAKHNETLEKIEDELVDLETKFNAALAEGNTDEARRLQTSIRHKNRELVDATVEQRSTAAVAQAVEQVRYEAALSRVEEAYPQLNPDSDSFDQDLMEDVVDMMGAGMQRGLSRTKALQRAVDRLLGARTSAQERATTVTPRVDEEAAAAAAEEAAAKEAAEAATKAAAAARKSEAVARTTDASKRTPPGHQSGVSGGAKGGGLTSAAVASMSEKDFDSLAEADLSKLRGDTL